ncbi:MAG: type ISP restriction/modification enzyme [Promethearchaeota archaeon]
MLKKEYFTIPEDAVLSYANRIGLNYRSRTATEVTYYPDLKGFLEEIFPPSKGYLVQINPKIKHSSNKPDLTVYFNEIPLFHIEAKLPDTNIQEIVKEGRLNDQIIRYRSEGVQLLITNFIDICLIELSTENKVGISQNIKFECRLLDRSAGKFYPAENAIPNLNILLTNTCEGHLTTISNIKKVINPLADIAKIFKSKAQNLLKTDKSNKTLDKIERIAADYLKTIKDDFKKSIFREEVIDENILFSDLFAQTIVYGTFSAWINYCQKKGNGKGFTLQQVGDFLPYRSFIREFFLTLKNKTSSKFRPILNELEKLLQKVEYKGNINTESIITTFYSDFVKLYDPETAKNRGVVYTPHEIVDFIIDGIDFLLKRWLNKPDGILSEDEISEINTNIPNKSKQIDLNDSLEKIYSKNIKRLRILDPAAGTMAFPCGLLHYAKTSFKDKFKQPALAESAFEKWVKTTFFSNVYAFEILMAPYVLGHIRTFITLENLGLKLNSQEYTLKLYLMNTLMTSPEGQPIEKWIFNNSDIGREIKEALKIRERRDIFVIMGNPPYNLTSQNNSEWINQKIQDYKKGLNEKNLKILSDDYVKFLRFGQWKIEEVGTGILAFITNSRYLDGQVFSVMRKTLKSTFDKIYIVNLHGDMRKKETGNPFDIRVGVSIAFMVRRDNSPNKNANIFYMDIPHNTCEEKYKILSEGFREDKFKLLPDTKQHFFIEIDTTYLDRYEQFNPIDSLFKRKPMSGIMAGRDRLIYNVDKKVLISNLNLFFNKKFKDLENLKIKVNDTKSWKKSKVFKGTNFDKVVKNIRTINYRGWDYRYIAYDRVLIEGHRMGYIDQINEENPAITVTKSSRKKKFETAFIVKNMLEKCFMAVTDTSYTFPLYLNNEINIVKPKLPYKVKKEQVFYYCYAILYSETYRKRYNEYLRKAFPRIPFPKNRDLFLKMTNLGKDLANIHLLNIEINPNLELSDLKEWKIQDFKYDSEKNTLFFDNPLKEGIKLEEIPWIKGISPEIWEYSIGTIKQIEQFLKSRQFSSIQKYNTLQRSLNHNEKIYLLKIISAISYTIEVLPIIDRIYTQIDIL